MGATADPWEMLDWSGTLADVASRFANEAEKRKIAYALKQANGRQGAGGRCVADQLQDPDGEAPSIRDGLKVLSELSESKD
jgi:hypothetical protein